MFRVLLFLAQKIVSASFVFGVTDKGIRQRLTQGSRSNYLGFPRTLLNALADLMRDFKIRLLGQQQDFKIARHVPVSLRPSPPRHSRLRYTRASGDSATRTFRGRNVKPPQRQSKSACSPSSLRRDLVAVPPKHRTRYVAWRAYPVRTKRYPLHNGDDHGCAPRRLPDSF